jgi:hypothetical protein
LAEEYRAKVSFKAGPFAIDAEHPSVLRGAELRMKSPLISARPVE